MLKRFHTKIPLSLEDSFELLRKSGDDIRWQSHSHDLETGNIFWKQSFWSLTGTAAIAAQLEQKKELETSVVIEVRKPLQVFDPLKLCDKIFSKLDRTWQKNLSSYKKSR